MEIRDILLCVEPVQPGSSLIENAVEFAKRQKATLVGLYPLEIPDFPGYVEAQLSKEILENNRNYYMETAKEAEAVFRKACTSAGVEFDWRCVEGERAETVIANSRVADLVLLAGGKGSSQSLTVEITGQVILESGRPIIILPAGPIAEDAGSRVVLAWNGGRESVRAAHNALPLLRESEWVKVVTLKRGSAAEQGDVPGAEICRHLAGHGVTAEASVVRIHGKSAGATLLEWAKQNGANMLVMGAYGHSRWRELVLGGVTAHVLRNAELPVFMSH